jgi:hypothetical protein
MITTTNRNGRVVLACTVDEACLIGGALLYAAGDRFQPDEMRSPASGAWAQNACTDGTGRGAKKTWNSTAKSLNGLSRSNFPNPTVGSNPAPRNQF